MSGNIGALHGWRSFFWLTVALAAFVTLMLVGAFPETKWHRRGTNHAGRTTEKDASHVNEKSLANSEVNSENASDASIVGMGKPNKAQFSLVQKPDRLVVYAEIDGSDS